MLDIKASDCWDLAAAPKVQNSKNKIQVILTTLKACIKTRNLEKGNQVHAEAVECGYDRNIYVANTLINMYAKCGSMVDARNVFDTMKIPTVVSWTSLILGYADNGQGSTALELLTDVPAPNSVTLVAALKACASLGLKEVCNERIKEIHNLVVETGCNSDLYVQNSLVDMYAKKSNMLDAYEVFDSIEYPTVVSWTALIFGYADNGESHTALDMFVRMRDEGFAPNSLTFVAALKACSCLAVKDLSMGKELHSIVVENGCDLDACVQNSLIDMYAKCSSMRDACAIFDNMKHSTVVSWTALILGYTNNGESQTALDLFTRMKTEGPSPNSVTLLFVIKACTCLAEKGSSHWMDKGKEIHKFVLENDCKSDQVENALIEMFARCGNMVCARETFDCMERPIVDAWNTLTLGYAENDQGYTALEMFTKMKILGVAPNSETLVSVLKACSSDDMKVGAKCIARGKKIHNIAVENGCISDVYVQNSLMDMYAKCGSMVGVCDVFECMKHPTVVSWNVLILGYADSGEGRTALHMFTRMFVEGAAPDFITFVATLKACTSLAATGWEGRGKEIHNILVESGCNSSIYVLNSLIDMYAKCGSMVRARDVFDSMQHPTVVSWTALILGYVDNGESCIALTMFNSMGVEGSSPDFVTLMAALKACSSLAVEGAVQYISRGKELHNIVEENGYWDAPVQNSLIDMYSKCGSMVDARDVFDCMKHPDVVSWTALILGYADNSQGHIALNLFARMRTVGLVPSSVTFGAALKACGLIGALECGRTIHSELIICESELDVVLVNCLVDFYAKCGSLVEAQAVFYLQAKARDIITWSALLAGFSSCGHADAVFWLFEGMQDAGFKPDGVTFLCMLTCYSHAGLVVKAKECFDTMSTKYDVIPTIKHYTCMIDIFGRANKLDDAMTLLKCMPFTPDDVTWRAILSACCKWKNVELGRLAFQSLINLNDKDAAAYVLMEQIYRRGEDLTP